MVLSVAPSFEPCCHPYHAASAPLLHVAVVRLLRGWAILSPFFAPVL